VAQLDGSFMVVNDGFCAFLGYTRDELLTLNVRDITHPDDLALTQIISMTFCVTPIAVMRKALSAQGWHGGSRLAESVGAA
jgi:PAS domain S-box-containing protein